MKKLTLEDIRKMTDADITAHWVAVQEERRKNGEPFYSDLIVPETGDVVARIDAK